MITPEVLSALATREQNAGEGIDFQKLSFAASQGFREVISEDKGAVIGKIIVMTRYEDDFFQLQLDGTQIAAFSPIVKPYFRFRADITRSKAVWPNAPVLERWHFIFGSQDPTEKVHFINSIHNGELEQAEFLRRFNASEPNREATEQLKEYLDYINRANGFGHWKLRWLSEEQPKITE